MKFLVSLFVIVFVFFIVVKADIADNANVSDISNGFGDNVKWVNFSDALERSEAEEKPIFLLIHALSCGACISIQKKQINSFLLYLFISN